MKHELVLAADVEIVILPEESSPRVSSQTIAKAFGKNHKEVLRRIKVLASECPKKFTERNFALRFFFFITRLLLLYLAKSAQDGPPWLSVLKGLEAR
ncbi:hypothetical protein C4J81_01065 [Deltaproteobacteria bacterium Smac51]|nr:hypothetical protein C4J81_01065 [Deltaproteobacteria bacterium Smac51]